MSSLRLLPASAATQFLERAAGRYQEAASEWVGPLRVGVDLGTATIVFAVIDAAGEPIYVDSIPSQVVRDGVVVDFHGAVQVVLELKGRAEAALGQPFDEAGTAYPPGVGPNESRACQFVLERAGLDCVSLLDEVSAANRLLEIADGVLVDVGGGSTGVGIIRNGELARVSDLPGGGHHLDLILAGALQLPLAEAESLKRERGGHYLHVLQPGLERVANSIQRLSVGEENLPVHLVGGALMIGGAGDVVARYLERPVVEYPHALYITPFGIARSLP